MRVSGKKTMPKDKKKGAGKVVNVVKNTQGLTVEEARAKVLGEKAPNGARSGCATEKVMSDAGGKEMEVEAVAAAEGMELSRKEIREAIPTR